MSVRSFKKAPVIRFLGNHMPGGLGHTITFQDMGKGWVKLQHATKVQNWVILANSITMLFIELQSYPNRNANTMRATKLITSFICETLIIAVYPDTVEFDAGITTSTCW